MSKETTVSRFTVGEKAASIVLSAALLASSFTGLTALTETTVEAASTTGSYGLASNIQDGNILHCFCWKYTDITAMLPDIAKAGFTSIQTSPPQATSGTGAWYWFYQPKGFYIGTSELGTKEELAQLCSESEKYGIKIIADVVANHLAGNHNVIQDDLKDSQYWHTYGGNADDGDRYRVTHGEIGMPDLNTENSYVQQCVYNYVQELKSIGVDGIRFDAAKHIGLPSEGDQFWSNVTKDKTLWYYGEILNNPGLSFDETSGQRDQAISVMKEYSNYIGITDSPYGMTLRNSFNSGTAPSSFGNYCAKWMGLSNDRLVYWGESHDTWSNNKDWGYSNDMSQNVIDRAYAVAASRNNITALYFSRPSTAVKDDIKIGAKGSTHFTSAEVAAVNHFKNAMVGKKDYYTVTDNCSVVTRQGGGAVIVKGSGSGYVTVENGGGYAKPGTYKDEITGNEFTVTSTTISGQIGDSGIAVIYDGNQESSTSSQVSQVSQVSQTSSVYPTLSGAGFVFDNSSTNWGTVYAYVYDESGSSVVSNGQWPGVAMTKANGNYWTYDLDSKFSGSNIHVIFNNNNGTQIPGAQETGYQMSSTDKKLYSGSWKDLPAQESSVVSQVSQTSQTSQTSEDIDGPSVTFSKGNGTTFTGETLEVTLTLKNATSGTYSVDGGPVKTFTSSATVVLGQGKIGDSEITLDVTAKNSSKSKSYSYTYNKDYVVETTTTGAGLSSYYSTNKAGTGAEKTITVDGDISDWDSSMIIAQGTANDDPRVYRPDSMYEVPLDLYALYGAYDDTNLYLMWEMTNVQDVVAPIDDYPISQGTLWQTQELPFFIAVDTGKSDTIGKNGQLQTAGTIWNSGITIKNSFNRLISINTKGGNGPFVYEGDSTGLNPVEVLDATTSKIKMKYGKGILSKNVYGIDGAYGTNNGRVIGDMCNESAAWVDFNTKGHASASMDFFYELSIPLSELGITKSDISNDGIGVLLVMTSGKSGMDCLPYDLSMNDNADLDDAAGSQEKNSFEKSDEDFIQTSFARIGNGSPIPKKTPLQVNFGANLSSPQYSTASLTLDAVGYGGEGSYTYQFYVDGTSVKSKNSTSTYTWKPSVGSHTIKCVITDSTGKTATVSKDYVIEKSGSIEDDLVLTASLSAKTVNVGDSVTAKASATGGSGSYQYAFLYKKSTQSSWTTAKSYSSTKSVAIKPAGTGTYNVCIKVKDSNGTEVKKYIDFTSSAALTLTASLSATTVNVGDSITAKASATGGSGSYKFAFLYKKSTQSAWTTAKSYSTTKSVAIKPAGEGTYNVCIKVKDTDGTEVKKYIDFTSGAALTLSTAKLSATTVNLGSSVTASAAAKGGSGSYKYAFYYQKSGESSWTTVKDFSTTKSVAVKPTSAGTYKVCIKVKDTAGTIAKKYVTLTVESPLALSTAKLSATTVNLGSSVTASAAATGGTGSYKYAFYYQKSGESSWTTVKDFSTTKSVAVKPTSAGTYSVCIKVKDTAGTIAKKYITLTVKSGLTLTAKLSATSIVSGNSVTASASATGGSGSYKFAFLYKKSTQSSWTTAKSYSTTKSVAIKPAGTGTYNVCIKVKDTNNTEVKKYIDFTSNAALSLTASLSASTVAAGGSVTAKASATGGTSSYTYAFLYKKSTQSSWTTAKSYSTTKSVAIKPAGTGTYNVCIKVKDSAGTEVKKYIDFFVGDPLTAAVKVGKTSFAVGKYTNVTASATGGSGTYTYQISYMKIGSSTWTTLKDYNSTATAAFKPTSAGSYSVRVNVKDSAGNVSTAYVAVTVS